MNNVIKLLYIRKFLAWVINMSLNQPGLYKLKKKYY